MNQAQKEWTIARQKELIAMCEQFNPITDEQAEKIISFIEKTVDKAKGKTTDCREEVRNALFDVIEKYDR